MREQSSKRVDVLALEYHCGPRDPELGTKSNPQQKSISHPHPIAEKHISNFFWTVISKFQHLFANRVVLYNLAICMSIALAALYVDVGMHDWDNEEIFTYHLRNMLNKIQPGAQSPPSAAADSQVPLSTNPVAQQAGATESTERWSAAAPASLSAVQASAEQSAHNQATGLSEVLANAQSYPEASAAQVLELVSPMVTGASAEREERGPGATQLEVEPVAEVGSVQDAGDATARTSQSKKVEPQVIAAHEWSSTWRAIPDTRGGRAGCAPGCSQRGVCNEELGRCDCPPHLSGVACDQVSLPSCLLEGGFLQRCHPSAFWVPTCECALECDAAGLASRTNACLRRLDHMPESQRESIKQQTQHVFSDGLSRVQVVFNPMHSVPPFGNVDMSHWTNDDRSNERSFGPPLNRYLSDFTMRPASECPEQCNNMGACVLDPKKDVPMCKCFDNYGGDRCEIPIKAYCINDCFGRGTCVNGICQCNPGTWGESCTMGLPMPESKPLQNNVKPKIYVYDVPRIFTSAQFALTAQQDHNPGCMHRENDRHNVTRGLANAYQAQTYIMERIMNSPHYTADAGDADYFLIPLWNQCLTESGAHIRPWAAFLRTYILHTWPYWNATGGKNHLLILPDDQGGCDLRDDMPIWANVTYIHHFGLNVPKELEKNYMSPLGCNTPGKDVVIPPMLGNRIGSTWKEIQANMNKFGPCSRDIFFFFAGAVGIKGSPGYSGGVREHVYSLYNTTPGYKLIDFRTDKRPNIQEFAADYMTSVFCLAPSGLGWGIRTVISIFYGCIPVVIQDNISMPFQEYLPWDAFSVRLADSEIANMDEKLKAIPPERIQELQANIQCVWKKLFWSSIIGQLRDETANDEDAFDVLMLVLRTRLDGQMQNAARLQADQLCVREGSTRNDTRPPVCRLPCAPGLSQDANEQRFDQPNDDGMSHSCQADRTSMSGPL